MTRFTDVYMPERIAGFPFVSIPQWSSTITTVASGSEAANQNWKHPKHLFTSPSGVRCWDHIGDLHEFWMAMRGPIFTFAMRDPLDSASRRMLAPNLPPMIFPTDQLLGDGDGFQTEFQLQKAYTYGGRTYLRNIYHPVVDTVVLAMNALELDDGGLPGGPYTFEVDRLSGVVTIDPAPHLAITITAGFLFDVEARWQDDNSYNGIVSAFQTAGFADLNFIEVTPC